MGVFKVGDGGAKEFFVSMSKFLAPPPKQKFLNPLTVLFHFNYYVFAPVHNMSYLAFWPQQYTCLYTWTSGKMNKNKDSLNWRETFNEKPSYLVL